MNAILICCHCSQLNISAFLAHLYFMSFSTAIVSSILMADENTCFCLLLVEKRPCYWRGKIYVLLWYLRQVN